MQVEVTQAAFIVALSGGSAWIATVATLKNDIKWQKLFIEKVGKAVERAHERIDNLEGKA